MNVSPANHPCRAHKTGGPFGRMANECECQPLSRSLSRPKLRNAERTSGHPRGRSRELFQVLAVSARSHNSAARRMQSSQPLRWMRTEGSTRATRADRQSLRRGPPSAPLHFTEAYAQASWRFEVMMSQAILIRFIRSSRASRSDSSLARSGCQQARSASTSFFKVRMLTSGLTPNTS